ncbi:helix-turn-helix domain-containing protein [Candidatus Omnitrophota bacterium]
MNKEIYTQEKKERLQELVAQIDEEFIRNNRTRLYKFFVEALEKPLIERILEKTDGNQLRAARILGINRNTLRSKIKKFAINTARWKIG